MQQLIEGVHKFRNDEFGNYRKLFRKLSQEGQNPHTLFITCSDSRVLAELIPGRAATRGRTVEIARGSGGSFSVAAQVNGARVPMVLDTGASAVVLTQDAAKAAGLPLEVLNYSVTVDTANGRARAAPVTLDRLSIGDITERSVPALVAQGGLRTSLLGMTFLNRLESWEVRGDKLMMRGYP